MLEHREQETTIGSQFLQESIEHQVRMDELGKRLKSARKLTGMTQDDVSRRLGLGAGVVTAYETGKSGISDERLVQLAQLYGVSPSELAGREIAQDRPDAFYDGVLHALAVFNKAQGELIAEVQQWRAGQRIPPGMPTPNATPEELEAATARQLRLDAERGRDLAREA